jgi:hypothetical protein
MFASALTLQTAAGLSPAQWGIRTFLWESRFCATSLLTSRVVARIGNVPTLLSGCAVQNAWLSRSDGHVESRVTGSRARQPHPSNRRPGRHIQLRPE